MAPVLVDQTQAEEDAHPVPLPQMNAAAVEQPGLDAGVVGIP